MLPSKRGSDDVGKFILCGNKRTCSGGDEKSDWISDDSLRRINPDIWSDMCKSVVSITLSYGGKMLFACSGIAIECQSNFTKFMTSASLVTALDDVTNGRVNVKIEVRHGGIVARGFLEEYDFDHAMAVIKVTSFLDVHCVRLKHEVLPPIENVVAVGCDIDGTLMNTVGKLTGSCGSEDSEYCILSTCQLSEVILGGALYGCDGTFLGMNLFLDEERAIFLPKNIILDCLNHLWPSLQKRIFIAMVKPVWEKKRRRGVELFSRPECSMKVNTSGGLFGDEYPSGVWGEFRNEVSSNIRGNVVALASFNGDTKFFSCTGFFINYVDKCAVILTSASLVRDPDGRNKIVKGLRIEVLLPNKARCEGKLDHYSLHYNVALVSVKNYNVCCPVNLKHDWINFAIKVVAVGFCFDSCALMAANGVHTNCPDDLDCENLCYTTCKTTKVGIGGPLVDVNGKFLGMNYYDKKMGTPLLCCDDICGILNYFRTKETKYWTINGQECHIVRDDDGPRNIWILPDSSDINEDELDSSDEDELKVNVQP